MQGVPFRDAYKKIGKKIEEGNIHSLTSERGCEETHEGSIGNLCNEEIKKQMQKVVRFISVCFCSIGNIRSIKMT